MAAAAVATWGAARAAARADTGAAARATERPGGARERPKGRMVRAFFVVYFALVHAFLARVLVSSATARSRA